MKNDKKYLWISKWYKWFSLVEIIISVAIIAILWAISTISLVNWLNNSKDAKRLGDMNTLITALENYIYSNNEYPMPDKYIEINYNTGNLWYQWYAWSSVSKKLSLKSEPTDPSNGSYYTYSITNDKNDFQLMSFLEWDNSQVGILNNKSYAADLTKRNVAVKGDRLGTFIRTSDKTPVQDIMTSLDVKSYVWDVTFYFKTNESVRSVGNSIITNLSAYRPTISYFDENLGLYLNLDEWWWIVLNDRSLNIMNWQVTYGSKWVEWIYNKWLYFDGTNTWTISDTTNSNIDLTWAVTISLWINAAKNPTSNAIILDKWWVYWIQQLTNWNISAYINSTATAASYALTNKAWQNITYTYDRTSIKLYLNWNLVATTAYTLATSTNDASLTIWSANFNGTIDEVRIYKKVLTNDEIKSLYNSFK